MKLEEISRRLGTELRGDGNVEIVSVAGIEQARPGDITFVSNRKYWPKVKGCQASAIILQVKDEEVPIPSLRTDNPYLIFSKALELFYRKPKQPLGVHPTAIVDPTAVVGEGSSIGAYVTIGAGVRIGRNAVIYPHTVIYPGVVIGDDVRIHSRVVLREEVSIGDRVILQDGVVIGSDGFGFAPIGDGTFHKILQAGSVVIEADVEIGANSTVDRATIGNTVVRRGTKIDNLVQLGHGSTVGENCLIAAQTGVAGSAVVGNRVILAGQVGIVGHLTVGDDSIVTAQSGVPHDLPPKSMVSGSPVYDALSWKKVSVLMPTLPKLFHRVRRLEKHLGLQEKE